MKTYVAEAIVSSNGSSLIIDGITDGGLGLPLQPGDRVSITIISYEKKEASSDQPFSLHGKGPYSYKEPFEPAIPLEDWEMTK